MNDKEQFICLLKAIRTNKLNLANQDGEYALSFRRELFAEAQQLQNIIWMLTDEEYYQKILEIYIKEEQ